MTYPLCMDCGAPCGWACPIEVSPPYDTTDGPLMLVGFRCKACSQLSFRPGNRVQAQGGDQKTVRTQCVLCRNVREFELSAEG